MATPDVSYSSTTFIESLTYVLDTTDVFSDLSVRSESSELLDKDS